MKVRCPVCDTEFTCGSDGPEGACWCSKLPPMPLTGDRCFCPKCLKKRLEEFEALAEKTTSP